MRRAPPSLPCGVTPMSNRTTYSQISDQCKLLGHMIRVRREALNLSAGDLATNIGALRTTVTEIEDGRTDISLHWIVRVCDGLGLVLNVSSRGTYGVPMEEEDAA